MSETLQADLAAHCMRLESELSATQQKLGAAEARIKASQEQEPVGYITGSGMYKIDGSFWQAAGDVVFKWPKLYSAPVIPPDVTELQRENAELTRKLEESEKARKQYFGEMCDVIMKNDKLLAEAKSKVVPEGIESIEAGFDYRSEGIITPTLKLLFASGADSNQLWILRDKAKAILAAAPQPGGSNE